MAVWDQQGKPTFFVQRRKQRRSARVREGQEHECKHLQHANHLLHRSSPRPLLSIYSGIMCPVRPAKPPPPEGDCPRERIENFAGPVCALPGVTLRMHGARKSFLDLGVVCVCGVRLDSKGRYQAVKDRFDELQRIGDLLDREWSGMTARVVGTDLNFLHEERGRRCAGVRTYVDECSE